MKCLNCGTENLDVAKFCAKCGVALDGKTEEVSSSNVRIIGGMPPKKPKKSFKWLYIILIAAICVSILTVGAVLLVNANDTYKKQVNIGYDYLDAGEYEEAILAFDKAIEIEPRKKPAYEGKIEVYVVTEEYEKIPEVIDAAAENGVSMSLEKYDEEVQKWTEWMTAENIAIEYVSLNPEIHIYAQDGKEYYNYDAVVTEYFYADGAIQSEVWEKAGETVTFENLSDSSVYKIDIYDKNSDVVEATKYVIAKADLENNIEFNTSFESYGIVDAYEEVLASAEGDKYTLYDINQDGVLELIVLDRIDAMVGLEPWESYGFEVYTFDGENSIYAGGDVTADGFYVNVDGNLLSQNVFGNGGEYHALNLDGGVLVNEFSVSVYRGEGGNFYFYNDESITETVWYKKVGKPLSEDGYCAISDRSLLYAKLGG